MSDSDSDVECSGITQPTLLQQIKTILDEYHNDVQIIKELVQNADDAEASEMGILYQAQRDVDHKLDGSKFCKFLRAPALIVYNNAEFTDSDWEGIKAIYSSAKKDDPLKIGRFGLGFKSVFHMTDNPCIISGESALFIDPHEKIPDKVCTMVKLNSWHKPKNKAYVDVLKGMFGFSEGTVKLGKFHGTLFCFSLRSEPSGLSQNTYSESEAWNLLNAFISESSKSLLFLKSLCSVKMYVDLAESGDIMPAKRRKLSQSKTNQHIPDLLDASFGKETEFYFVTVTNSTNDLIRLKQDFLCELKDIGNTIPKSSMYWTFDVTVETKRKYNSKATENKSCRWFLLNYLKGGELSEKTLELLKDEDLRYIHLVGLAAPIHKDNQCTKDVGQVFCYQPLPYDIAGRTRLPVHVNAFFALSQNRRQVRWPDQDDDGSQCLTDKKIEWNIALLAEMFPEAYQMMVQKLVHLSTLEQNPNYMICAVHNTVPDLDNLENQWKKLATKYLSLCKCDKILYTEHAEGTWISPQDAIFADFSRLQDASPTSIKTVLNMLMEDHVNIIRLPSHVMKSLASTHSDLQYVTPNFVKKHMTACATYKNWSRDKKDDLLEFISLDTSDEYLDSLELLPLADATYKVLLGKEEYYLEEREVVDLFPGKEGKFVATDIRLKVKGILTRFVDRDEDGLKRLSDSAMVTFLEEMLCGHVNRGNVIEKNIFEAEKWLAWGKGIWDLIQKRFWTSLKKFVSIPLFPHFINYAWCETHSLRLLPLDTPILNIPSLKNIEDKEIIYSSFELMGVHVTDTIPEWLNRSFIQPFLPDDTSEGVVSVLAMLNENGIRNFNAKSSGKKADAILKYICERIHSNVNECKQVVRQMKVFRAYISQTEYSHMSLNDCNRLFTESHFPVQFPYKMIIAKDVALAKSLGIEEYDEDMVVRDSLKHIVKYKEHERQGLMRWLIIDRAHYIEDQTIGKLMLEIEFLKTGDKNEELHKPCDLFDPGDKALRAFFHDSKVFPLIDSKDQIFLKGLQKLGLKTKDHLTSTNILETCQEIHNMDLNNLSRRQIDQCHALLKITEANPTLIDKKIISEFKCILIKQCKHEHYPHSMPLKNRIKTKAHLCLPSEVKSSEYIDLVGSVFYTINCESLPKLCTAFCWQAPPTVRDVLTHLSNVVRSFQCEERSSYTPIIETIYKWLYSNFDSLNENMKAVLEQIFSPIDGRIVWVGDDFQPPKYVYIEEPEDDMLDLRPFLHTLPMELKTYVGFFKNIGCNTSLKLDMYLDTLERIKKESEVLPKRISHRKLRKIAVSILKKLSDEYLEELMETGQGNQLLFPIIHEDKNVLKMKPIKQCTFCDAQWLKDMELDSEEDVFYVHADVTTETAEILGVPSLRQQMLSNSEAFEEWGQEEPLTRRLRNLLKDGYVDGFSVAKELFQNADDAGASELSFLFDERENNDAKSKLISDGMSECQGPAIWAYNNALFTVADFKNITRLSGGTKSMDSTKIGKFGLGFCAVYNITDVPSFVSGDCAVIFDPHTTFLGKALPGKSPGLKIDFSKLKNQRMMKRLKNQFKPFDNVFSCTLKDGASPSVNGTLFRLPLRNKASEISDIVYSSPKEVGAFLEKTMSMAADMLLFNQSVKKFKIYHLPKNYNDPLEQVLQYEVKKQNIMLMPDEKLSRPLLRELDCRKKARQLEMFPLSMIEKVEIEVHNYEQNTESACTWYVSWATGTTANSLQRTYKEDGAINIGAVAVPIIQQSCSSDEKYEIRDISGLPYGFHKKGHLFFFLPLPIEHPFLYHINSQFAVTSDRRMLQTSSEDDKHAHVKEWNESLLNDPISRALLFLLENMKNIGPVHNYAFTDLWPNMKSENTLLCLQQSFYQSVTNPGLHKVFEKDGHWFDISQCLFLDCHLRNSNVGDEILEIMPLLTEYMVVDIPTDIYCLLHQANEQLLKGKTVSKEQFIITYLLPNLKIFETNEQLIKTRNRLLLYAIDIESESVKTAISSAYCIPCQPEGYLRCPRDLVDPASKLERLYSNSDGRFPILEFAEKRTLESLRKLGMMTDVLPDEMVIDRASSVQTIHKSCCHCSSIRAGCLIAYLSKNDTKHVNIIPTLKNIAFFPVKCKPKQWPFKWYADERNDNESKQICSRHHKETLISFPVDKFATPRNTFHSTSRNLVGCVQFVLEDEAIKYFDTDYLRDKISSFLIDIGVNGLNYQHVETDIVIAQLEAIANEKHQFSKTYSNIFDDIYRHLEHASISLENHPKIEQLKFKRVIRMKNTFACPNDMAQRLNMNCEPFLFDLSDSKLLEFPKLVKCLGIVSTFNPSRFALCLQQIKRQKKDEKLSLFEVQIAINILTCLIQNMNDSDELLTGDIEAIYAPDENGILRDCKTMCFNDFDGIEKSETMIYVHGDMPHSSIKLGIKPKAIQNLEENSEDIEDFYQEEPLVTRLQRLVEGYPCDSGIFKELLQNADDAKANKIVFLKDYTTHSSANVIDKSFTHLQGPALCVYDDSGFSNENLKGIQSLGRGSKSDDPSQTGRYGVGFNAIYNITDAPSFYTKHNEILNGETMCFFDPLAKYIPKVTRAKPGKRYKNLTAIKHHHSNMMSGYHAQYFLTSDKGTVFRFPLRNDMMAQTSDIKKDPVSMDTISTLLDSFCKELTDVVLFLKNLKEITVLTYMGEKYILDYCISIEMEDMHQIAKNNLTLETKHLHEEMKGNKRHMIDYKQKSHAYEIILKENIKEVTREEKYIIVETIGFSDQVSKEISPILKNAIFSGKIGLSPHGGVAFHVGKYKKLPQDKDKTFKAFCFLPLPIMTGLPVHVHGYFCLDHESRRSLWKGENAETCYKTLWNNSLVRGVITPAYVMLLQYIKEEMFVDVTNVDTDFTRVAMTVANYQSIFPKIEYSKDYYWKYLTCCVYNYLVENQIPFLPNQNTYLKRTGGDTTRSSVLEWTPLRFNDSRHLYPAYVMEESIKSSDHDIRFNNILRRLGLRIVYANSEIKQSMQVANVEITTVSPGTLITFLCSFQSSTADKCRVLTGQNLQQSVLKSLPDVIQVLTYGSKDKKSFLSNIYDLPLMITQDNIIRTLSETNFLYAEPNNRYCAFFPSKLSTFLKGEITEVLNSHIDGKTTEVVHALKVFNLQEFVTILKETNTMQESQSHKHWSGKHPNLKWISTFWDFFRSRVQDSRENVLGEMQTFHTIPLIPAIERETEAIMLGPPCDINRLINLNSFSANDCLYEIMTSVKMPQIYDRAVSEHSLNLLNKIVPKFDRPCSVIDCLCINRKCLERTNLSSVNALALIRYFNDSISWSCIGKDTKNKLMSLPIFESSFGQLVSLSSYEKYFLLNSKIPNNGLEDLANEAGVLLVKDYDMNRLHDGLQMNRLNWSDVYEHVILPNQNRLSTLDFYEHIRYLSRQDGMPNSLLMTLKETAFIEVESQRKVRVCDLFDPSHPVFRSMCNNSQLVPECLSEPDLLQFFKKIGLNCKMTMPYFEEFAKTIEQMENDVEITPEMIRVKSKLLVSELLKMDNEFFHINNFKRLRQIKFISPNFVDVSLATIHPQLNQKNLFCFELSVMQSSTQVSWTVANILPKEADPSQYNIQNEVIKIEKLGICKEIDIHKLIQHCVNLGKSLDVNLKSNQRLCLSTVENVMMSAYTLLEQYRNRGTLTKDIVSPLDNVPFIYFTDNQSLCLARRIVNVCKEDEEIPPYLNKCPCKFAQFQDLFLVFGAKKEPTCGVFISVMNEIKNESCKTHQLLPKETADSVKAMEHFFKYLNNQSTEIEIYEGYVNLLSENKTLVAGHELVFGNNRYYQTHLKRTNEKKCTFLIPLENLGRSTLNLDACLESLKYIPEKHRPKLLTEIVQEKINLADIVHDDREIANELNFFFQSRHFVTGFLRLARHAYKMNNPWSDEEESRLIKSLQKICFSHVSGIRTYLALITKTDGNIVIERRIEGTDESKSVHIEITGANVRFFFDTSEKKWFSLISKQLAVYLNGLVSKCLGDECLMILMEMIDMKESPGEISTLLDKNKILEYTTTTDIDDSPTYPIPGSFVPKPLLPFLDNDYSAIQEYDYKFIALEIDDPSMNDAETDSDISDEENDPVYIFIHIIRKSDQESDLPLFQKYEIDDGSETTRTVNAYQLYKFVRKNETAAGSNIGDIVISGSNSFRSASSNLPDTFKEAYNEIKKYLLEAWKKSENERRKIVNRLLLKWHPDKNPTNVPFCTKVFQFIQQCLKRLKLGLNLDDDKETEKTYTNDWSSSWHGRYWYRRRHPSGGWSGGSFKGFDENWSFRWKSSQETYTPFHWYSEGRRWMRQAQSDLENARHSMQDADHHSCNWIVYQAHQAAEKGLKAAWYAEDANKMGKRLKYSHDLNRLANGLFTEIAILASRISSEAGDHSRTRYPDMYSGHQIPAEAYTKETANTVIDIAFKLLQLVREKHIK